MVGYRDHKESFLVDFEQKRWDQVLCVCVREREREYVCVCACVRVCVRARALARLLLGCKEVICAELVALLQERKQGGGAGNDSLAQGIGGAAGVVTVQGDTDRPEAIVRRHQGDGVGAGQVLLALGDQVPFSRARFRSLSFVRAPRSLFSLSLARSLSLLVFLSGLEQEHVYE